jgi:hypothetical protein
MDNTPPYYDAVLGLLAFLRGDLNLALSHLARLDQKTLLEVARAAAQLAELCLRLALGLAGGSNGTAG